MSKDNFYFFSEKYNLYIDKHFILNDAMSLFDDFKQGEIIQKPTGTWNYLKIWKARNKSIAEIEAEKKAEWKQLLKQKKEELSPEEYHNFRAREWARRNKKDVAERALKRYHDKKKQEEEMLEEIYNELWPVPDIRSPDIIYAEKYRKDDVDKDWKFLIYWWLTRMLYLKPHKLPKYKNPIKVSPRSWFIHLVNNNIAKQNEAYEYLLPHLWEISLLQFNLNKKQLISKHPTRKCKHKMLELCKVSNIPTHTLCNVASAMLRDKLIKSMCYLGRVSYLVGDIIISQNGNVFRPSLDGTIPWLTPDTVDELHDKRVDFIRNKKEGVDVYVLRDCYLSKVWDFYYIIPT